MKIFRKIHQRIVVKNRPLEPAGRFSMYFKYALGEVFIVVIGVLVAFALNSWWNNVKEGQTRKIILSNLLDEMEYNNHELQQTLRIDEFVLRNTEALEEILQNTPKGEQVAVADTIISSFITAATKNPSNGSLNSILSSGKIDYINNNELITSIITWNNKLDDATEDEQTAFNFIENQFLPAMRDQVDLSDIFNNSGKMVGYIVTGDKNQLSLEFLTGTIVLLNSNSLNNLVLQRKVRLKIAIGALKRLQKHQMKMLQLIQNVNE